MGIYRKKPVEVEAERYKKGMEDGYACYALGGAFLGYFDKNGGLPKAKQIPAIKTLEGFHEISEGDYIITRVNGERCPCRPDIFALTYDLIYGYEE
jgi:hypothetical protein